MLRLERNVGGAARNAGVRAATTPLVAFFDDDSWWAPLSLTCAADVFAAHIGGEETLLAIDLRSADWTLTYRSDVQVHHAPELSNDGRAGRRARQMRNVVLITVMRRPLDVVTREMVALGRQALGDGDARTALRGVLRRLPAALSQRSVVDDRVERELRLLSVDDAPLHPIE